MNIFGHLRSFILLLTLMIAAQYTYAQGPGFEPGITDTPLDGGLSLIVAGGVAYGAKKLHERRKKQNSDIS